MQRRQLTGVLNAIVHIHLNRQQEQNTFDVAILHGNVKKIATFVIELSEKRTAGLSQISIGHFDPLLVQLHVVLVWESDSLLRCSWRPSNTQTEFDSAYYGWLNLGSVHESRDW